jgi:hypothetical protein
MEKPVDHDGTLLKRDGDRWDVHCITIKKLKLGLPYGPASLFWACPQRRCKYTCALMFTVAWFPIAKVWKQPLCSCTDEWIKKLQKRGRLGIAEQQSTCLTYVRPWVRFSALQKAKKTRSCGICVCVYTYTYKWWILFSYRKEQDRAISAICMAIEVILPNYVKQTQKEKHSLICGF